MSGPKQDEGVGVAAAAVAIDDRLFSVIEDVQTVIRRSIPEISDDGRADRLLNTSVAENVATLVHMLRYSVEAAQAEAPTVAIEYARRLARQGLEPAVLVQAYRVGQQRFTQVVIEELMIHNGGSTVDGHAVINAVTQISDYIDRVVTQVLQVYDHERIGWLQARSMTVTALVDSIIAGEMTAGEPLEREQAERRLGYRFDQSHVGLEVWVSPDGTYDQPLATASDLIVRLASAVGCVESPLFIPRSETSASAWLPMGPEWPGSAPEATVADLVTVAEALIDHLDGGLVVATGSPCTGLGGFRRSAEQAAGARAVAVEAGTAGRSVTSYMEVAPIVALADDTARTRAWVADTLGPLAVDSADNDGLRETVRVFFETGESHSAAASFLGLHRNTVRQRIRRAEEMLGHPLADNRLEVELALTACRWLGPAVRSGRSSDR